MIVILWIEPGGVSGQFRIVSDHLNEDDAIKQAKNSDRIKDGGDVVVINGDKVWSSISRTERIEVRYGK